MNSLTPIIAWVLASAAATLLIGFYLGRSAFHARQASGGNESDQKRQSALTTLVDLLKLVEDLTSDVDTRSTEMKAVHTHMGDMQVSGELETIRQVLLEHVATVLESNQKLEDDLIYARCRMEQQAEELDRTRLEANTDSLCGVGNRKAFDEKLRLLLGTFKRGGDPFVLILVDMDHFKWINDTHGHPVGDKVLRQLGDLFKECARETDFVTRYGGDEFAILLPKADREIGLKVAERLRQETSRANFGLGTDDEEGAVTLSIGLALSRTGDTVESIIERADRALYVSKNRGRNQIQFQSGPNVADGAGRETLLVAPGA